MKTHLLLSLPGPKARNYTGSFAASALSLRKSFGRWLAVLLLLLGALSAQAQNLSSTVAVSDDTPNPGQAVTYTLTVVASANTPSSSNVIGTVTLAGTGANQVSLSDISVSNISNSGTYNPGTGVVQFGLGRLNGNLAARTATRTFTVTFGTPLAAGAQLLATA